MQCFLPNTNPENPQIFVFWPGIHAKTYKTAIGKPSVDFGGFPQSRPVLRTFFQEHAHHTMLHISGGDLKVRSHFHTSFIRCSAHHAYFVLCWVLLVKNCLKIFSTSWCHLPCICNCLELEPVILPWFLLKPSILRCFCQILACSPSILHGICYILECSPSILYGICYILAPSILHGVFTLHLHRICYILACSPSLLHGICLFLVLKHFILHVFATFVYF